MNKLLVILAFHRVLPNFNRLLPDELYAERFDSLLIVLKKSFQVLPLTEALPQLKKGKRNLLAITFDDGYKDNYSIALPILLKHDLRATFFVASGFLKGGWMWNDGVVKGIEKTDLKTLDLTDLKLGRHDLTSISDRRFALDEIISRVKYMLMEDRKIMVSGILKHCGVSPPENIMMDESQVVELDRAGMEIGGHTINHPILSALSYSQAVHEIKGNKEYLESLLNKPVNSFAYPNGKPGIDFNEETITIVRQSGYSAAVTTVNEIAMLSSEPYQLPRFTPWDRNPYKFMLRIFMRTLLSGYRRRRNEQPL